MSRRHLLCIQAFASLLLSVPAVAAAQSQPADTAGPTTLWDIRQKGLFDSTNKAYPMTAGRVDVDLQAAGPRCPTGLGELASGRENVREVHLLFGSAISGSYYLHVVWDPGGSGREQFSILYNGQLIGDTPVVDAAAGPNRQRQDHFQIPLKSGQSDITLVHRSGDGLNIKNIVLCRSETMPASATAAASARPDPAPGALRPDLKYPTLADYEKAIKEPGLMLDSQYVRLYAPKVRSDEAGIIFPYLVKAYDELYKITGRHTRYKIVVYHFPQGHPDAKGGTSECTIWYGYENLDLAGQEEWTRHHVPHVAGYIEEMAHNFVDAAHVQFGWEMIGWTLGAKVTQKVAGNPVLAQQIQKTRQGQMETFQRYIRAGHVFPKDLEPNQCDRIHAWILYQAEMKYGPNFWPDFFAQARKQYDALVEAGQTDGDASRNSRYRITIDCFDKLDKVNFRESLKKARISLTTDVKSLHPMESGWDRTFLSAEDRRQAD